MTRLVRLAALGALLLLSACATTTRLDAGPDVHAFLVAIRDNDRPTFERHVDRRALERQIETRLLGEARASGSSSAQVMGALLGSTVARLGGEILIQPRVFRSAAILLGYSPDRPIPGALTIASALRYEGEGRVCAAKNRQGPCLLIFERQDGVWRLTEFGGEMADVRRELGR